jgi:hypothetical protein
MYCPRCAQQQVSDEMRFCSRCGLPLGGLMEWLAFGGAPAGRVQEKPLSLASPRRKGIRRGAKVMFFSGALLPVTVLMSIAADEPFPLFFPVISFIVGLTITLYSYLFGEDFPAIKGQPAQPFGIGPQGAMSGQALPPASSIPIYNPGNPGQRVRTNELAQPPSVTEHTTKLLDNE